MRRRHSLTWFIRGAVALAVLITGACQSQEPAEGASRAERPNILVIVTDDQRATGTLEVMPATREWFSEAGTTFSHAYATTPLCCPSRASIFSGRYAHGHEVRTNEDARNLDQDLTIQKALQEGGYRTAITGKYLNRWPEDKDPPYFDDFAIFLEGEFYDRTFNVDGEVGPVEGYSGDVVQENALRFLSDFEEDDEQPWFLYIGTPAAHAPFTPPERHEDAEVPGWDGNPATRETDVSDKTSFDPGDRRGEIVREKQLRTLMGADDLVDAVMQKLEDAGEAEDTLAIFMSDNGILWGEHGFSAKRLPFTQSVNIPLIVRWPGRVDSGETDDRLAANIDVFPTIAEAAEVDVPRPDGRSLLGSDERQELLLEQWQDSESGVPDWASILTKEYQYVEYYRDSEGLLGAEYYDLEEDPWQLENLLAEGSPRRDPAIRALSAELARLRTCAGQSCP